MNKLTIAAIGLAALSLAACQTSGSTGAGTTASTPSEADAVVAAIKAEQSDFGAYCRSGRDALRRDVTNKVVAMVASGEITGDPSQVGPAAGQKIAAECRP